MTSRAHNARWGMMKGRLMQGYALLLGGDAAFRRGRAAELTARFRRKWGFRATAMLAIAGGCLLLTAAGADAQTSERPAGGLSIGPQVGFFKAKDADDARVMFGAAMRLKVSEALGIEASVNYREEEYSNGAVTVKSWPVMVTGLLYPVPMIYGAIGVGWYNSAVDFESSPGVVLTSESMQEFGWHFGGGVELPVGSVAKLVGDVRYVFLDYEFQAVPGSNAISSNFYVIDVGLLFHL